MDDDTYAALLGDELAQAVLTDPQWDVYESPPRVQLASWLDMAALASLRKTLPAGLAKRVIDNIWIDPGEESGFLTREDVAACEDLGRTLGLIPTAKGRSKADAPEIDGTVHVMSRRPLRVGEIATVRIERSDEYDLHGTAVGF